MTRPPVAVLDYGVGNLHSAAKALDRAGAEVRVVPTVAEAGGAAGLVVPGVGAYGACLNGLASAGGAAAVAGWLAGGRPLLGICVGMQLLFEASEEGPVGDGVGVVPGKIRRLTGGGVKIPHIGWDEVTVRPGSRLFAGLGDGTRFYFVHSYAPEPDGAAVAAVCDYGGRFAAAVEHGNLFGTQFHPEKSGQAGLALLANFVTVVGAA
jgi:imidazole glycerol-phosphate synthase subunit HisH